MLSIQLEPFPVLETERLILRRFSQTDAADLFQLRSDQQIMKYIGRPLAKTIEDVKELISIIEDTLTANNGITWAITLKGKENLVGTIGLWRIMKEHYRAEIGYLLARTFQGKGLMQEAMEVVLDYGFGKMQLHSVEAVVHPENIASVKLLEKNHFKKEAHFKENFFYEGKFRDSFVFSLLNAKTHS